MNPVVFGQPIFDQVRKPVLTDMVSTEASGNEVVWANTIQNDGSWVSDLEEFVETCAGKTEGDGAVWGGKLEDLVDEVVGQVSEISFRVFGRDTCDPSNELWTTIPEANVEFL